MIGKSAIGKLAIGKTPVVAVEAPGSLGGVYVKVAGIYTPAISVHVKVGGVYRQGTEIYMKQSGAYAAL